MKKNTLILLATIISALIFTACRKDYTCSCTVTLKIPNYGYVSGDSTFTFKASSKKSATNVCSDSEKQLKEQAEAANGGATCSIN